MVFTLVNAQPGKDISKPFIQKIPNTPVSFTMQPIPGGSFVMGSPENDKSAKANERPSKKITLSPFWMGKYEVTHDEFQLFLKDEHTSLNNDADAITRPSPQYIDLSWGMGKEGGFPANSMQQMTAVMYCRWLYKKTGVFYRLPTEAEWEYAARAGSQTVYPFGNSAEQLGQYAWYNKNSEEKYHKVGQKKPNKWGLYDMLGNVSEWTLDQYDKDYYQKIKSGEKDPMIIPVKNNLRSIRGGNYECSAEELRPSSREYWLSSWNKRDPQIPKSKWWLTDAPFAGFRVVCPEKQPTPKEAEAFFSKHIK